MTRQHDWMLRLERLMSERRAMPFAWGSNDCCMWAADAVQAVTGRDPAADLRGTYTTQEAALEVIEQAGGLRALAAARLGLEVPVVAAQTGDVGLLEQPTGDQALCVCMGGHWQAVAPHGLWAVPTSWVLCAWRCEVA
jgi:hypothetical protein